MTAWAVPTELQESTHPEIAILENYYEVGERGVWWGRDIANAQMLKREQTMRHTTRCHANNF